MEKGSPAGTSSILCKYFVNNCCNKGSDCPFSHDRSTPPDLVCRYYQYGHCFYGDKCRFDHVRKRDPQSGEPVKKGTTSQKPPPPLVYSGKEATKNSSSAGPATKKSLAATAASGTDAGSGDKKSSSATASSSGQDGATLSGRKGRNVSVLLDSEPVQSSMVTLGKSSKDLASPLSGTKLAEEWVKAKEFVPGQFYTGAVPPTYASAVGNSSGESIQNTSDASYEGNAGMFDYPTEGDELPLNASEVDPNLLCPFMMQRGSCRYGDSCRYTHGELCDLCGLAVLHPTNEEERDRHVKECVEFHERDMELSFRVAASQEKSCGICMENVLEKEPPSLRRFGVLENCNHCFCLSCIRQWRCAKFQKTIIRACPECRVNSNFVTPSEWWIDNPEEKTKLIQGYKKALSDKPCRHFDQGRGECPFNDKCFYKHALPDGTLAPPVPRKQRRRANADGNLDPVEEYSLWDFLLANHRRRELGEWEEDLDLMNSLALALHLDVSDSDSDL